MIKLHPFLETFHPAHTFAITEKYKNIDGLLFIAKFPSIYPILSISDIYIGDFSSIGYDFLFFNRPMFFLTNLDDNLSKQNPTFLHQCGKIISKETLCHLKEVMHTTLKEDCIKTKHLQKEIYNYAFGGWQDVEEIKTRINIALKT
jgi:CDP-glycerol glycerophosphotransferase (TagB/SpsB family)